jgi:hypothetical protein
MDKHIVIEASELRGINELKIMVVDYKSHILMELRIDARKLITTGEETPINQ